MAIEISCNGNLASEIFEWLWLNGCVRDASKQKIPHTGDKASLDQCG